MQPPSTRESWVAIDFETANLHGASVWEVGMVAVSAQWAPIATFHRLIRPRPPYDGQRRWDPVYAPMPPEAREADEFDVVLKEMLDFIDGREEISVDYAEGELIDVTQHDGNVIRLRKLAASYSPHDRVAAMNYLHERSAKGEVVTGLLYVDEEAHDLHGHLNTATLPLNRFAAKELSPGAAALAKINASLR